MLSSKTLELSTPFLSANVLFLLGARENLVSNDAERKIVEEPLASYQAHLVLRAHSLTLPKVKSFVAEHVRKYKLNDEARGYSAYNDEHEYTMFRAAEAVIEESGGKRATLEAIACEWCCHSELEDFVRALVADLSASPQ